MSSGGFASAYATRPAPTLEALRQLAAKHRADEEQTAETEEREAGDDDE